MELYSRVEIYAWSAVYSWLEICSLVEIYSWVEIYFSCSGCTGSPSTWGRPRSSSSSSVSAGRSHWFPVFHQTPLFWRQNCWIVGTHGEENFSHIDVVSERRLKVSPTGIESIPCFVNECRTHLQDYLWSVNYKVVSWLCISLAAMLVPVWLGRHLFALWVAEGHR